MTGLGVLAWIDSGRSGYVQGGLPTDAMGRYTLQNVPEGARVWVQLETPGLVQQCAVPAVPLHADQTVDVQLVSRANLSVSPTFLPPPAPGFRFVSGTVFEATQTGTRPAAGAYVDYEPPSLAGGEPLWAAETFSDAEGHYLMCGLPDAESVLITAITTHSAYVSVPPGVSTGVDLVIR